MRTSLAADRGMLFVFPDTAKNTLIALGILYFDAGRRLLSVQRDVSPCKAAPCRIWASTEPARYVLELSSSTTGRIGVHDGDTLAIEGEVGPED